MPLTTRSWFCSAPGCAAAFAMGFAIATPLRAQIIPGLPGQQEPRVQEPEAARNPERHPLELDPMPIMNEDPFQPGRIAPAGEFEPVVPEFVGFPIFPAQFSGYAGYPELPAGLAGVPQIGSDVDLPLVGDRPDDWPSWILTQLEDETGEFKPDRAMLIRDGDRVWYMAADEQAFEPLAYYSRVRVLTPGSRVQVRTRGSYQVAFHGGARMVAMGRNDIAVEELGTDAIAVRLFDFSRLWVFGRDRRLALALPDGAVLTVEASSVEGAPADLYLLREGRIAFIHNSGPGKAYLDGPFGETAVPPGHRVGIALEARVGQVRSSAWRREGELGVRAEGSRRLVEGVGSGTGGAVEWSGVRVRLPVGARLEIDPLGGELPVPGGEPAFPEMQAPEVGAAAAAAGGLGGSTR